MASIMIRKMELKDIDSILEVEENSFSVPWTRSAFISEITKNKLAKYIVAEVEGKAVAYGGMWLIVDEGHITNIAVHPTYRGMGLGTKIVEGLIKNGHEMNIYRMTLEVRRTNLTAQKLYKKLGFMMCGVRPGYYQDNGEDAIIMWKDLM